MTFAFKLSVCCFQLHNSSLQLSMRLLQFISFFNQKPHFPLSLLRVFHDFFELMLFVLQLSLQRFLSLLTFLLLSFQFRSFIIQLSPGLCQLVLKCLDFLFLSLDLEGLVSDLFSHGLHLLL